jgi:hypothetical protein
MDTPLELAVEALADNLAGIKKVSTESPSCPQIFADFLGRTRRDLRIVTSNIASEMYIDQSIVKVFSKLLGRGGTVEILNGGDTEREAELDMCRNPDLQNLWHYYPGFRFYWSPGVKEEYGLLDRRLVFLGEDYDEGGPSSMRFITRARKKIWQAAGKKIENQTMNSSLIKIER